MSDTQTGQRITTCTRCRRRVTWSTRLGKWLHLAPQALDRQHVVSPKKKA